MPEGTPVIDKGKIYHGDSEQEAIEVFRRCSCYALREKMAKRKGKTFDMPIQTQPLVGIYVMDVQMPDGEASDQLQDECDTDAKIVRHPLSTKLVHRGPFDDKSEALKWRDENTPDCLVCQCPPFERG
jgi:hypothetical protein